MTHPADVFLDLFEAKAEDVTTRLQDEAMKVWLRERRPVSVNDVRHILDRLQYRGDPRILAAAFPRRSWIAYGYTTTNSLKAHKRGVRTFIPRHSSAFGG